jgi:hypothetical protein
VQSPRSAPRGGDGSEGPRASAHGDLGADRHVRVVLAIELGAVTGRGFLRAVVFDSFLSPVFWLFLRRLRAARRWWCCRRTRPEQACWPYRVPLFPFTPLLFAAGSATVLMSSIGYVGLVRLRPQLRHAGTGAACCGRACAALARRRVAVTPVGYMISFETASIFFITSGVQRQVGSGEDVGPAGPRG